MARITCGEMLRPAIGQVVAVHRGDHHMLRGPAVFTAAGDIVGLVGIQRRRASPVLTLQKAQARVQVSPMIIMVAWRLVQHSPIFGTGRLLAHGVQLVRPHDLAGGGIFLATPAP